MNDNKDTWALFECESCQTQSQQRRRKELTERDKADTDYV